MRKSHQAKFNTAFERLYQDYCDVGLQPNLARENALNDAWTEYENYCDEKMDESRLEK